MTISGTVGSFADSVLEITAHKVGILLTHNDTRNLIDRHEYLGGLKDLFNTDPNQYARIRAEELEAHVIGLRKALGNVADLSTPMSSLTTVYKKLFLAGYKLDGIAPLLEQLISERAINDTARIEALCPEYGVDPIAIAEVLLAMADFQNLSILDTINGIAFRDWDGARSLGDLFSTEIVPKDAAAYLDQAFINYLKENGQDLERIHWRNFERLMAQFFHGKGYTVILGPGSADGGIDIRIWKDIQSTAGPPLILVQCKRYSKSRTVSVDSVKALYADVLHEGAGVGMIATTSRVSAGGKKIISARAYNMQVAESKQVNEMIHGMWKVEYRGTI